MTTSTVLPPKNTTKVVNADDASVGVRRTPRLPTSWLLFLGTLAVYGLTRTHLNTFDAVAYANQVGLAAGTGKLRPLFHPHHLLFNALVFGLWRLAQVTGYAGGPLAVAQGLNAALGAWGVALFYGVLRRLRPAGGMPLILALGLAGSFGWWVCATDGRVNMPSAVLMLAAFGALPGLRARPAARRAAQVGLLAGVAVLFHESAGLFGVVGAVGVGASAAGRLRGRLLLAYGAAWIATVAVAYGLIGALALGLRSPGAFGHWMNAYAERGWWWDFHVFRNVRLDLFGLRHAVFVQPLGRAALASSPLAPFGTSALGLLWLCYGLALLGLTAAACAVVAALPGLRCSRNRPIAAACLAWVLLYGAFFTVWCPGAFVFWVPVLVPLGTLLLLSGPRPRLLGVWVGAFALLNFLGAVLPYLKPVAGLSQRVAVDVHAHTPPRALIVVSGVGDDAQCEVDIPYFADRPVLSLHGLLAHAGTLPRAQASLDDSLRKAFGAGRQVYVLGEVWDRRDQVAGLARQSPGLTGGDLRAIFLGCALQPAWTGPRGPVWRLFPAPPPGRNPLPPRRTGGDAPARAEGDADGTGDGNGIGPRGGGSGI